MEGEACKEGEGEALSSICALEGVIISHLGVRGAKTVICWEGSSRRNLEEDVVVKCRER